MPASTADLTCLQCGAVASFAGAKLCRRCGLPFGEAPPASARLAECPVCYATSGDDGRFPSSARPGTRVDINTHVDEHERFPVGDDEWLEIRCASTTASGSAAGPRRSISSAATSSPGSSTPVATGWPSTTRSSPR